MLSGATQPLRLAAVELSNVLRSTILLNEKGDIYMLEPYASQQQPGAPNLGDRDSFLGAVKTGKTFWSDVNIASTDGTALASVATPIKDKDGKVQAVMSGSLQFKVLNETAAKVNLGAESAVMLFDSKGKPIVYPDNAQVQAAKPLIDLPAVADALAGKRGADSFYNPFAERDEIASITQLKSNGWFVVVTQSRAAAFAEFNKLLWTLAALLVVGIAAIVGVGYLVARSISRNVRQVAVAAAALAEGDVQQEIHVSSQDEVGQMAASFRDTVSYLREMAHAAEAVSQGDLTVTITPRSAHGVLGTAVANLVGNLRDVVAQVSDDAAHIAETGGQLGEVSSQTSQAVADVSGTIASLATSAEQTSRSATSTSEAVHQLSQAIDSIAWGAAEQARQIQSAASTASSMADEVDRVAANAGQVAAASQQTRASAEHGAAAVRETVTSMGQIQRIAEEAEQLAETSASLRSLVAHFRLDAALDAKGAVVERRRSGDWSPATPAPQARRRAS